MRTAALVPAYAQAIARTGLRLTGMTVLAVVCAAFFGAAPASVAVKAETGKKALVLGSSVSSGASSREATRATSLGFAVTVVDDTTYKSMTAAQFADYQLVIIGDPTCSSLSRVVSENAQALADAVMARAGGNAKAGNRILIGTDPVYHYSLGGNKVVDAGIEFAGVQEGASGLYLDLTCFDPDYNGNGTPDGQEKLLPLLSVAPSPVWTQNQSPPCGGGVSLISNAAQFSSLKSSDIRGWGCSVHETFPTFPTDWSALAIATDTETKPTCGKDVDTGETRCGEAYLLIAGSGIVSEAPNLSITPATDTNAVGTQHTVTATVTNTNGSPRSGVLVSFVVTGANAGATGTCAPADCKTNAAGKVTFTYTGARAGDDTINAAITVDGSRQTATASKTWTTEPPPPPPPTGEGSADLSLSKAATNFVTNGQGFAYTLVVKNNGPDSASGITVTDKLPSGVSFASASPSQGSCSGTVTCALGTIASGRSATVTINVTAVTPGFVTNTAKVSAAQADPNTGNNSDDATTRISPRIDLGIRGTVTPEAVGIGGDLTYHIVVTNGGPDLAEGVLVPLTIPVGATFVSVTPSQGICIQDGTILCFLGRIASGGSATVDLVLRGNARGDLVLSPTVSSDGGTDSNSTNNATSLTGTVAQPFDLRLEMTSTPAKVGTGEWVTYTITVTNLGPGAATGVKVVDQLPETVAFVSCETTLGECTSTVLLKVAAGRTIEARLGRLGAGDSGTVKILGRATGPGTAINSATASGGGEDPALGGNNESTAQTPVTRNQFQPPADVPPPVFNQNVDAAPVSGTVRFRRPGSNTFEVLVDGEQLPLGTEFDTTTGTMLLTSATDTDGAVQTAEFWDGFFVVTQTTSARRAAAARKTTAVTDLRLTRGDFSVCKGARKFASLEEKPPPKGKGSPKGKKPPKGKAAKGKKPEKGKKKTTTRQLWGNGKGKFRTKGRYSSAAIRGTYWLTADRCDGTLTSVREGSVTVRDLVRKRTIIVRAGRSYLARPR